ncbi:hypothetical protein [Nostoc sp. 2RC]|uniref:hypothetical protein n=1 Tax=Nostoc sp. 2RC TaxID=2485484 RepID=UPI0016242453|nr:hypothetical protein [Nostoc sp. 2RC]MBC1235918.1 hypothetical protein [Nostoc sp. 2RC]
MSNNLEENQEQVTSEELDLGITVAPPQIDYEAAIAKTKPDFQRMVKLLGIQPSGSTQEDIEQDLLTKQTAFEADLKSNLVPKVQAALQGLTTKYSGNSITPKPGVSVTSSSPQERKLKAWKGY